MVVTPRWVRDGGVRDLVLTLLPDGSRRGSGRRDISKVPAWPPDVFAVAATVAECVGAFGSPRFNLPGEPGGFFTARRRAGLVGAGRAWADGRVPEDRLQRYWDVLLGASPARTSLAARAEAAMALVVLADEAAHGIGFTPESLLSRLFFSQYFPILGGATPGPRLFLRDLPSSACLMVPKDVACVLPKTRTPEVGCSGRSFSHHLALLPGAGVVEPAWRLGDPAAPQSLLNLLLVPFPYRIDGRSFTAVPSRPAPAGGRCDGYFRLAQDWLEGIDPTVLAGFLRQLVAEARREAGAVHGIVLPEGALPLAWGKEIARALAEEPGLELFVCGFLGDHPAPGRNGSYTAILDRRRGAAPGVLSEWTQHKHHRWKLDPDQIKRYHLGHSLTVDRGWWEFIDVRDRSCVFHTFRPGASVCTLVCEDLARIEPVQRVVRAVGPSLVVALLMDGPQLEFRWPGRYATMLADDPGSAVLTLTCLGMARRSVMPGEPDARAISLWKECGGSARSLVLPAGCHGLLLSLSMSFEEQFSLDGRSDRGSTARLALAGAIPVRQAGAPAWAAS